MSSKDICAVIDAQGFFIGKTFFPREISFVNNEYQLCFEVFTYIPEEFRAKNSKLFYFQEKKLHGIPIRQVLPKKSKKVIEASELEALILSMHLLLSTSEKTLFGVKNQQLAKILEECEIPIFNLEKEEVGGEKCPALPYFDRFKIYYYCRIHQDTSPSLDESHRCALFKSTAIWDWLNTKHKSDKVYDFTKKFITHVSLINSAIKRRHFPVDKSLHQNFLQSCSKSKSSNQSF